MKRKNNLYAQVYSMDNLVLAEKRARRGKQHQYGVIVFDRNPEAKLLAIHEKLKNKTYRTSAYKTFTIYDPKERVISCLPYQDRIVHHAVMNILEKIFTDCFTADTYSCIKGRGIHAFDTNLKKALRDVPGTQYCLKIDIKKFYPSIVHRVLKAQLCRKIKDPDLLWLLDEIIDSAPGVPIGNYLSQYFANFYLTGFDHWLKEMMHVKYYFRYADDIVILSDSKEYLHALLIELKTYLQQKLNLTVKDNHQVTPVRCGIDVGGYVYRHGYTRLRKRIKQNFARAMARKSDRQTIAGYIGWAKHANCKHLIKTLLHEAV